MQPVSFMTLYAIYSPRHSLCFQPHCPPFCSPKAFCGSSHLLFSVSRMFDPIYLHGLIPFPPSGLCWYDICTVRNCLITLLKWQHTHRNFTFLYPLSTIFFKVPFNSFFFFSFCLLSFEYGSRSAAVFMCLFTADFPGFGSSAWHTIPLINICFINEHA